MSYIDRILEMAREVGNSESPDLAAMVLLRGAAEVFVAHGWDDESCLTNLRSMLNAARARRSSAPECARCSRRACRDGLCLACGWPQSIPVRAETDPPPTDQESDDA